VWFISISQRSLTEWCVLEAPRGQRAVSSSSVPSPGFCPRLQSQRSLTEWCVLEAPRGQRAVSSSSVPSPGFCPRLQVFILDLIFTFFVSLCILLLILKSNVLDLDHKVLDNIAALTEMMLLCDQINNRRLSHSWVLLNACFSTSCDGLFWIFKHNYSRSQQIFVIHTFCTHCAV